jgi:hypothetical protein
MKKAKIELSKVILDPEIQSRVELDESYIEDLKKDLMEGAEFPAIIVFSDDTNYWPGDGAHRLIAHQRAGRSEILAEIRRGGKRDAKLFGVGANATHGKRRSNADKRKAVETLLKDEEWGRWSDRQIGKACRVSQPLVSAIRKELTDGGFQFPATRKCSDGREMDVSQIGSNRGQETQQPVDLGETSSIDVQAENPESESQAPTGETQNTGSSSEAIPQTPSSGTTPEPSDVSASSGETQDGSTESDGEEAQETLAEAHQAAAPVVEEDIPTLKAKVASLEAVIQAKELELQEKDRRIAELEKRLKELEENNSYLEKEIRAYEKEDREREAMSRIKAQRGGMPLHG